MFIDASAMVGILARESDAEAILARMSQAKTPFYVSSLSILEAVMGLARAKASRPDGQSVLTPELIEQAQQAVGEFVNAIGAKEIPITNGIGRAAQEAAKRYGRLGAGSAKLNFGDCFAYACSKAYRVPLLYKGDDFAKTDLA